MDAFRIPKGTPTMPTNTESGLTRNKILSELSRSPHGNLKEYVPIGQLATLQEPEFVAHLIAWDHKKGQVRDAKVALPIVTLSVPQFPPELAANSLAHLAQLSPRELAKGVRFALELRCPTRMRLLRKVVELYLRNKEKNQAKWDKLAVQHRKALKELYALAHIKPSDHADAVLFKGARPEGSIFETIKNLSTMSPTEAAGAIITERIPFLIALGALGKKAKEPDLVLALIKQMSPTELVTNTKMLERLGVKTNPALRGAFDAALGRAAQAKPHTGGTLKTTRAAEAIEDESLKAKLRGVQDKQLASLQVEGNWLVLGDKSSSMRDAIELAKRVAATLAKMVKGKVWLVFFDTTPQTIDVTGMSLDVITNVTRYIQASGSTSIGCGLQRMLDAKEEIDGIAIVSDGGENQHPAFASVYKSYSVMVGKQVPVYLYQCQGDPNYLAVNMHTAGFDLQIFDLTGGLDYYSLPNIVQTMRTNRYSLIDEILATPLLSLHEVFKLDPKEINIQTQVQGGRENVTA
jgi:hypothetical protein